MKHILTFLLIITFNSLGNEADQAVSRKAGVQEKLKGQFVKPSNSEAGNLHLSIICLDSEFLSRSEARSIKSSLKDGGACAVPRVLRGRPGFCYKKKFPAFFSCAHGKFPHGVLSKGQCTDPSEQFVIHAKGAITNEACRDEGRVH